MKDRILLPISFIMLGLVPGLLAGCGPRGTGKGPGGPSKKAVKKGGNDLFREAVDRLNGAIQEGNELAIEELVSGATLRLLMDIVAFSPTEAGGGVQNPTAVDFLDFEKRNGVNYVLNDLDEAAGTGRLQIVVNGEPLFEGEVTFSKEEGKVVMDFEGLAQGRLDKVQSEGILRTKYEDVIEKINEAIGKDDGNALKEAVALESLNLELKVRSYTTRKKKDLSLQGIVDKWKEKEVRFEISNLDINAQTADLEVASPGGTLYEGKCSFTTEVGTLKLDFSNILNEKIREIEEKLAAKTKKKKK